MTLPRRLEEYASPAGAQEYLEEYRKVHRRFSERRERRLLEGFFRRTGPLESALDLPAGWGRYLPFLHEHCRRIVQSDYSGEMLHLGRRLHGPDAALGACRALGTELPFGDRAFDLVFSMRLNHHLADPALRRRHLEECFRAARRYALFSYFDAAALKNRLRELRRRLGGGKRAKNVLARAEVAELAAAAGFRLLADPYLFAVGSGHRLVLAERERG